MIFDYWCQSVCQCDVFHCVPWTFQSVRHFRFSGLNRFFPILFPTKCFPGIFWKSLEFFWNCLGKVFQFRLFQRGSPNEHVFSNTIYLMLSKHYFHMDVHRHDRGAVYNASDVNIKKFKWAHFPTLASAGPVHCSTRLAQGSLRWRLQT